jgi:integrating conjugative element protein (TIGR03759 family)
MLPSMVKQILFIGLLFPAVLFADTDLKQSTFASKNLSSVKSITSDDQSRIWDISVDDWKRIEQIMLGKGQFLWKDLDPITVLGLNARSDNERKNYAEKLAKLEFTNAQKVILLDRAYNKAFHALYGKLPVVDPSKLNIGQAKASLFAVPTSSVKGEFGDRYIAFVNTQCSACNSVVKQVLGSLQLGVSLDIHFKNDSRQAITRWATKQGISPESVEVGTITLNPDSALIKQFGQPKEPSLYYFNKATNQVSEVK